MPIKACSCGSGLPRFELRDAAGIFLSFVCNKCYETRKATYNQAIFRAGSKYAAHGTEEALEADDYDNHDHSPPIGADFLDEDVDEEPDDWNDDIVERDEEPDRAWAGVPFDHPDVPSRWGLGPVARPVKDEPNDDATDRWADDGGR